MCRICPLIGWITIATAFCTRLTLAESNVTFEKCLEQASNSEGMDRALEDGGRLSAEEYLIDQCGTNPTTTIPGGRRSLLKKDCDELYTWTLDGTCEWGQLANYQYQYIKHLDPHVFEFRVYSDMCKRLNDRRKNTRKADFANRVCVAPISVPSKTTRTP